MIYSAGAAVADRQRPISLAIPNISRHAIDAFIGNRLDIGRTCLAIIVGGCVGVFVFTFGLSFVQTYTSERVARDLRTQLTAPDLTAELQFFAKKQLRPSC